MIVMLIILAVVVWWATALVSEYLWFRQARGLKEAALEIDRARLEIQSSFARLESKVDAKLMTQAAATLTPDQLFSFSGGPPPVQLSVRYELPIVVPLEFASLVSEYSRTETSSEIFVLPLKTLEALVSRLVYLSSPGASIDFLVSSSSRKRASSEEGAKRFLAS